MRIRRGKALPNPGARAAVTLIITSALLPALTGASPAHAAAGDLVCPAGFQANFIPPLTASSTEAAVSIQVLDLGCVSPNGAYPDLGSGVWLASGTANGGGVDPCSLLLRVEATGRIIWSPTGQRSEFALEINLDPAMGDPAATVVITSGVMMGDGVTGLGPLVPNADCAVNGLRSLVSVGVDVFG